MKKLWDFESKNSLNPKPKPESLISMKLIIKFLFFLIKFLISRLINSVILYLNPKKKFFIKDFSPSAKTASEYFFKKKYKIFLIFLHVLCMNQK